MTDVLSSMLNDPLTRAELSAGGEDSLDQENRNQDVAAAAQAAVNAAVGASGSNSDNNHDSNRYRK